METPITFLGCEAGNRIYVKHEEFFPFSLGGSKARIAAPYFEEIEAGGYDCAVTYGGVRSNLCRVVAAMAAVRGLKCVAVMHGEDDPGSLNLRMVRSSGASVVFCPAQRAAATISDTLAALREKDCRPFFIPGGGQGVTGTHAYVGCFEEIEAYMRRTGVPFRFIFLPSGTGTAQSGLVCGKLLSGASCEIVGISIAREAERGRDAVLRSVGGYFAAKGAVPAEGAAERAVIFEDAYNGGGYGRGDYTETVARVYRRYAVPLDNTYTGKAFYGMLEYLKQRRIAGESVLFVNTGGVPLFFEDLPLDRRKEGSAPCEAL